MQEFLQTEVLQNSAEAYLISLALLIIGIIAIRILRMIVLRSLKRWAQRTTSSLDDALVRIGERSLVPVLYLGVVYLAVTNLTLYPGLARVFDSLCIVLATILGIRFVIALAEYTIRLYWITHRSNSDGLEQSLSALVPAVRAVVWALGLLFLLDNLGFDISAVVAGLGIGGVAVALASQGILQDLFSYFSILFDRPFELGDFIIVGDVVGTVERVGIKTTRIRSLGGEELVVSNTDLTGSRISNFRRMERRRVAFTIGVTYETGINQLERIPALIKEIIVNTENTVFDRAHFFAYGEFSLNFEIVYFVTTSDYTLYMDTQQTINMGIKRAFEANGIDFAYPTMVHYMPTLVDQPVTVTVEDNHRAQPVEH